MIIVLLVSIYTTRVVLKVLGVEDYGTYNVVCGFVAMFSFLNSSMSNGIQRFYNYEGGKYGIDGITRVYRTSLILQVLLAIIIFIILETLGLWYVNKKMILAPESLYAANSVFQCSVCSLGILIIQIPYSAAILAYERMDYHALVSIIDVFLKLIIVLILPYIPLNKLFFYGFLQLIVAIVNFLLYFLYAVNNFKELTFKRTFDKKLFISISTFSGWNILDMFAWMTQGQGVNMVLNLFFGPILNAARGISGQIQASIQSFSQNIVTAFRPQLVQSYAQNNLNRTTELMYSMSKIVFLLFFLLSTPIIFDIDFILQLWLGNNIPEYTAPFTILILLSMYPRNFAMVFAQIVHATGKLKGFELLTAAIIITILPFSYFFLKIGANVMSVYWINLIICSIMFLACIIYFKRIYPFDITDYCKRVLLPCFNVSILSLLFPLFTLNILPSCWLRFSINAVFGSCLCIILSIFLLWNKKEKRLMRELLFKHKK